jgi:5,5'-dehydrodivanillate O-demethylase oxygenase subunit
VITKEMNDRLTQVGPGTPMGNLLRRYWHPVGTVDDLDRDPVRPVRLLGEDLVLFRDAAGTLGLVGNRCAHRGIALAYGIPQENGLRCAYHGWTYNAQGQVVDMPFEPACLPLKITSYTVQELGGLVFAYPGPAPAPLLPRWDLLVREDLDKVVDVTPLPCNWLQCVDNALDPVHFEHLHGVFGNYVLKKLGRPPGMVPARHVKIEFDVFEYGIAKRRLLEGECEENNDDWEVGHPILFPHILAVGAQRRPTLQIRVPVDDAHTIQFAYRTVERAPGAEPQPFKTVYTSLFDADGRPQADNIPNQDMLAWVEQGPIADRPAHHQASSDKGIMLFYNLLLDQIARVERGEDPLGVIRDPAQNEPMIRIARERHNNTGFQVNYPDYLARISNEQPVGQPLVATSKAAGRAGA